MPHSQGEATKKMYHGRFVLEEEFRARKEALGKDVNWEHIIKKGIQVCEIEKADFGEEESGEIEGFESDQNNERVKNL